jgi:Major Facilitator Superfamily
MAHAMLADIREGFAYIMTSSWLWVTIFTCAVLNMTASGARAVVLPTLIRTVYHANVGLFGALSTAAGIGAIAMTLAVGQMRRLRRRGIIAYSGLVVASTALLTYGLPFPREALPAIALAASLAYGAGVSLFSVIWNTVLQDMVPMDKLGRVSSVDMLGGSGHTCRSHRSCLGLHRRRRHEPCPEPGQPRGARHS